jgi:hypothetical protein
MMSERQKCDGLLRRGATVLFLGLAVLAAAVDAHANWLTHILKEAGESGGKAGKLGKFGIEGLDNAAAFVSKLPASANGLPLAAHVTAEGHWSFVNKAGQTFTAGTADEMTRVVKSLAPDAPPESRLAIYLSEETVFRESGHIRALPEGSELYVVTGDDAYRLTWRAGQSGDEFLAEVKPNLVAGVTERRMFDEAVYHLGRPLNRSDIRVLGFEPGGPKTLSAVPNFDRVTKTALVDTIDPSAAAHSLAKLRGQTALLSGRVEGDLLHFNPSSGASGSVRISDLSRAAEASDVNLVILQTTGAHQPGWRNWLWQKVEVAGLEEGLQRATFGDFLSAVGAGRGELVVRAQPSTPGRIMLSAMPSGNSAAPLTDQVGSWLSEITNRALGQVVSEGAQIYARDKERESELERRFVPGIPSWIQYIYIAGVILGLLGFGHSAYWWSTVWPQEQRSEYAGAMGFNLARTVRQGAFLFLFLPVAGIPAFTLRFLENLWYQIKAPIRWWRWLREKFRRKI